MRVQVMRRKKHRLKTTAVLGIVLFFLVIIKLVFFRNAVDFWRYNGLDKAEASLVINDEVVGSGGVIEKDGIYYISLDAISENIDPDIYYNSYEGRVIITTADHVVRMTTEETQYLINEEPMQLNFPVFEAEGKVYLPTKTLEEIYDIESCILNEGRIFSVDADFSRGSVKKGTRLYTTTEKGKYFTKVKKGESVYIYARSGDFSLVKVFSQRDYDGFVGYIRTDLLEISERQTEKTENPTLWQPQGRINLIFDQISNAAGATKTISGGKLTGVNVLCPTWFSFKDASGEIVNKANKDYVDWAKNEGYQVWGLVTDNFDSEISHAVLSDDKTRQYVIKQLLAYAKMYGLDGINLDFESVPKGDGEYWIQFLRELTPLCHKEGLVVSADLFVPKLWTAHYNRKQVGEIVDYVIVMGYDEHYSGSTQSGSVASYDWSVTAVKDTINAGVPKEKLILGIPFYTRIWLEKADGTLECKAYSMDNALEFMQQGGAAFSFDEKTQQNYAEFTDDEGRHRCWLEDEQSVKKRVGLVNEYDIAGVGAWKLRMESDGIFAAINSILTAEN